jgi:hypothetical protein
MNENVLNVLPNLKLINIHPSSFNLMNLKKTFGNLTSLSIVEVPVIGLRYLPELRSLTCDALGDSDINRLRKLMYVIITDDREHISDKFLKNNKDLVHLELHSNTAVSTEALVGCPNLKAIRLPKHYNINLRALQKSQITLVDTKTIKYRGNVSANEWMMSTMSGR